jgi:hypothetical protein
LADIYEPAEIERRFATEEDKEIISKDIPERLQLRYKG